MGISMADLNDYRDFIEILSSPCFPDIARGRMENADAASADVVLSIDFG
jgi:hypothetical protein